MNHDLPYVHKYKDRHGKDRTYYRRNGQRQRIDGEVGNADWLANYARIHESFERPEAPAPDHETLGYAIRLYLESPRFKHLRPDSSKLYRKALNPLVETIGHRRLDEFTRGRIIQIRDTIAQRSKSMAKLSVVVLKLVFEHAIDMDFIDRNPAKGIQPPHGIETKPHRRWTEAEIDLIHNQGRPFVRRAMMVLLYTGLRCSDAIQLKRGSIKDGKIRLVTQKKKKKVVIPVHAQLRAELDNPLPVESFFLMPNTLGRQASVPGTWGLIKSDFIRNGISGDAAPTTHGLRKNAVSSLVEAGCTPRQIQSITGQSLEMIEHYAKDYERDRLSDSAMILWEKHTETK